MPAPEPWANVISSVLSFIAVTKTSRAAKSTIIASNLVLVASNLVFVASTLVSNASVSTSKSPAVIVALSMSTFNASLSEFKAAFKASWDVYLCN